tara:strand:+ start:605 stop:1183 length:579 start_codon:yes stop_codon:yes gene_type:complete
MSKPKSIYLKDFEVKLIKNLKDPFKQNKAFEILIDIYKEKLYFQIRRIVLNHDDTDDILQNVFIKVFRGIKGFKGQSKLSTWIYRIAYNESLNFLKLKEKKYFYSSEIMMNTMVNNLREDPYFDGDEVALKLQGIISRLPKQQKIVFQMKYFQELKFREISEITDVTIGALKASFHLAKKKIIKELKSNQTF